MNSADSLVGTRIGPYDILSLIGVGGMGEVYRARDTDLQRDVAIKVLPAAFVADRDRLARFEREARVLASLNHPHISAIYGIERGRAAPALVLELVEGETLDARLKARAPADGAGTRGFSRAGLEAAEALAIAGQIAKALEAAHEKGIVHRDLKPANIKITPAGTVKVLDFGLAKQQIVARDPEHTTAPTVIVDRTEAGVVLGTAAYMSPEQARGFDVDQRTDVWAFGCVLFEMLAGQKAFPGGTMSDQIAAILEREPNWAALPSATPDHVRTLLRRCLEKDPSKRFPHIGAARSEIDEAHDGVVRGVGRVAIARSRLGSVSWGVAAFSIAAALVALWAPWREPAPAVSARLVAELGADVALETSTGFGGPGGAAAILSPDGSLVSFLGVVPDGNRQLYVRRLSERRAIALPGTEGARGPFFSPDGQWIAFFAHGKLKKVAANGGAVVTLCDVPDPRGGTWSDDGTIAFAAGTGTGLSRVSAAGGTPASLTRLADREATHRWPQALPGGSAMLYVVNSHISQMNDASIVIERVPGGPRKVVLERASYARYLRSGHLAFVRDRTLFAAPFDLRRLELSGQPVPILDNFAWSGTGATQVSFAETGTLVYVPAQNQAKGAPQWIDREGKSTPMRSAAANWGSIRVSPDGSRLATTIAEGDQTDVWTYDWSTDSTTRVTFDGTATNPRWTADGRRIVFASKHDGPTNNLYWRRADGTGDVQRLTTSPNQQTPWSMDPAGRFLIFEEGRESADIMMLPLDGDETAGWKPETPLPLAHGPGHQGAAALSPDGRWIAYQSDEAGQGRYDVYVQPLKGQGKWLISSGGGVYPRWSRTRPELFYLSVGVDQRIMLASYSTADGVFRAQKPRAWSDTRVAGPETFDVHPDGERVVAITAARESAAPPKVDTVVFILNFFDELRRLAPAK